MDLDRFGERRVLCSSESPLPSCLEEMQPGLGWDLALGQGQFCNKNKTKPRFLMFCSNQLSQALPPE